MRGARGSSCSRSSGWSCAATSASAGFTRACGKRSNTRGSPTVENTRFLWPMLPAVPSSSIASSTLSRLWAGSPMPMKTTFFTGRRGAPARPAPPSPRSPSWRTRPSLPGHAEHAADGAADLRRDAQAVARQQHAFDRLAVGQSTSSRSEPSAPGCCRLQARQAFQLRLDLRQGRTQRRRQEGLDGALAAGLRQRLRPQAQNAKRVGRRGAGGAQRLPQLFDLHPGSIEQRRDVSGRAVRRRPRRCAAAGA